MLAQGGAGKVYISKVKYTRYNVVLKLMKKNKDNIDETKIMKNITEQILLLKHSKHFTLFYNYYECGKTDVEHPLISVSELADGDLYTLLTSSGFFDNVDVAVNNLYNLLVQCIVSLGTFHNFGYIHNDAHDRNFFYQTNNDNKEGYYKYKYDTNKTFYIKSCKYNLILSDFGQSIHLNINTEKKDDIKDDIIRILERFNSVILSKYNNDIKNITNTKLHKFINDISTLQKYLKSTYNFADLLKELYTVVPQDILSQTIPKKSSNILNKQDFDITIKDSKPVM
jgi:hypothetical protein